MGERQNKTPCPKIYKKGFSGYYQTLSRESSREILERNLEGC
jgi:hypothetical protein